MEISKLDAARRQLDAAIELYFFEGDEVAVHTLAAAAYEVVTALWVRQGNVNEFEELVAPERKKEFRRLWNEAQNFFKHADNDPDAVLDFKVFQTEVRLFLASWRYGALGERSESMVAFQVWFSLANPDVLLDSEFKRGVESAPAHWGKLPRSEFRELISGLANGEWPSA